MGPLFCTYDLLYLRFFDLDKNLIYTAYMLPNETVESAVRRAHRRVHLAFALCFILTVVGGLYSGVITESNAGYLLLGYEPIRCLAPWFLKSHLDKLPTTSSVVRPTPSQQRAHSTRGWTGVGSLVFGRCLHGVKSLASPSLGSVLGFAAFGFLLRVRIERIVRISTERSSVRHGWRELAPLTTAAMTNFDACLIGKNVSVMTTKPICPVSGRYQIKPIVEISWLEN